MGKCCLHASSFIFDRIIIKVTGNQDRHKSFVEFDFGPNQTTHFGVTCPWVTKISPISLKPVGQSWSNFMCNIIGMGERLLNVLGQIGSKLVSMATESPHWFIMGKMVSPPFLGCFRSDPFYIFADNEDMYKIWDEFEFRPDRTTDYGFSCPWVSKKFP